MEQSSFVEFDKVKEWDRKQDRDVKRNIILDAAEQVFSHKDYHEAVLDEIAGVAGLSKATLYLYFKNKIDLFFSVIERKLWELGQVVVNATVDYVNPVTAIKRLINDELAFFADNAAFFRVFYAQRHDFQFRAQVDEDEIHERVKPFVISKTDAVAKVIKCGQEIGAFQSVNERDAAFMLISLIHTCVLIQLLEPENVVPMKDRAELVEKIFLNGLLVRE
ncbi:TetR/AcrR family transcriptional regulator [Candidatus Poribacteria bacterium]|nr:TetR/AcrR family transcriptional regulator [Candidatus Poribacteria bacterium]